MPEPNDRLRAARERIGSPHATGTGLSREELADLVNRQVFATTRRVIDLSANYVGKLERGQIRWPQADYRSGLRAVLGVATDTELGFERPRRSRSTLDDVDRKEFLKAAIGVAGAAAAPRSLVELVTVTEPTPVPSVIGRHEIDEVRTAAQIFSTWDNTYGGGLAREAVAAQLRHAVSLLGARCSAANRQDLYSAVGSFSNLAGWMAFDAHAHHDARRMFRLALSCSDEASEPPLRAEVLASMARQSIWCGQPDDGLTMIETALVRADRLTATSRAMLHSVRARALATMSRASESLAEIGRADDAFADTSPENDPPWMAYYDEAHHQGDTGHALYELALRGTAVTTAKQRLGAAATGHADSFARSRAFSAAKLSSLTMATGDPDEAVQIGHTVLKDATHLRSRRASDYLRELRAMAKPHAEHDGVDELSRRISVLVAG